ncbi:MAG: transcriptional repressor LexA [Candidatus Dormibacteraeota bacterium]|nr:transcriptional repressor LexA [Candidatus Dormibacteraeota bacterium]
MTEPVEGRQRQILEFLRTHSQNHSYPPTVREIGQAVGLSSSSTVQNHLNALETKGLIRRDPTKSRTVEVVGAETASSQVSFGNVLRLPLVGRVAAGTPMLAAENIEDHVSVGPEISGGDDAYALTVHGDSMIEAGIHDGDIVLVRPRQDAANGTIVVARIENEVTGEGEVTVKRFFRENGRIRLQPENSALEPMYPRDVTLEGVVTAVIRVLR